VGLWAVRDLRAGFLDPSSHTHLSDLSVEEDKIVQTQDLLSLISDRKAFSNLFLKGVVNAKMVEWEEGHLLDHNLPFDNYHNTLVGPQGEEDNPVENHMKKRDMDLLNHSKDQEEEEDSDKVDHENPRGEEEVDDRNLDLGDKDNPLDRSLGYILFHFHHGGILALFHGPCNLLCVMSRDLFSNWFLFLFYVHTPLSRGLVEVGPSFDLIRAGVYFELIRR